MSNPPSGYNTPKTNWQSADVVLPTDLNRIEGNINAIETGSRTIDPAQSPSGNSGSLRQWLDWFPNMIKKITGKTNWYDTPDTTLAAAKTHIDATTVHGATSSATANRIILRDANGRAKVAAPSAADDISTKGYVDSFAASVSASDALTLIYVPAAVTLYEYPSLRRKFRMLCPGSYRVTFQYRTDRSGYDAIVYLYRIHNDVGTLVASVTDASGDSTTWKTTTRDVSGFQSGDYLGFCCHAKDADYWYAKVQEIYVKASPVVQIA